MSYLDLAAFTALPRTTGLALSHDGTRLVASVQAPDEKGARYVSALWEIPLDGGEPVRLTHSAAGESAPAFLPDGRLLFASKRPDPGADGAGDDTTLWALPATGEASVYARRPGGLTDAVVAAGGAVVVGGQRLAFSTDDDDAKRRTTRADRRISAVLHTGMPVRHWDHDLDESYTRLLMVPAADGEFVDLAPDARGELDPAGWSVTADGTTVATSWRSRRAHGRSPDTVLLVDVASGGRRVLADEDGWNLAGPVISPDGTRVALSADREGDFGRPPRSGLALVDVATGKRTPVELDDLHPTAWTWSPDSSLLFVTGDLHGRGAVVVVDPRTAGVLRRLADDAVYSALCPAPDGRTLYALRSAVDSAPAPVRLDVGATDQHPVALPDPAPTPELPGRLEAMQVEAPNGASVHSWLCLPEGDGPHPVMLWIHGGPFASYNSWNWRWNPWVAVAHGWAVIMPDPALSTGYGPGCMDRAWPYRADVVWDEVQAVLDAVCERAEIDENRTALLGGSFGGFMTNWIAGRTDRFGAIVTHAGLWALDQQHATTDAAAYKTGIFGTLADHPDWYAAYSPHNSVDAIRTPMLITHGLRDYRVPFHEALRLWWDLVSRWDGPAEDLPHRFLQFAGENHWVLSPANSEVWYDAVLGFCAEHVLGRPWTPSPLL